MRILSRTGVPVTMPATILGVTLVCAGCAGLRVGPRGIVQAYPALSDDQIRAAIALPESEEQSVAVHRGPWGNFDGDEYRDLGLLVEVIDKTDRAGDSAARLYILEATDAECRHKKFRWNRHAFVAEKDELVYAKDIRADVKLSMEDVP